MTYKETMEEALNRGHNAAKSIGDAGNEAAKNLYKKAQDAADHIEESVNKVAAYRGPSNILVVHYEFHSNVDHYCYSL